MSTTRTANAHWEGNLTDGKGSVSLDSSNLGSFDLSWSARAEAPQGMTSPDELLAAAHAGCFSMAFSNGLAKAGTPPQSLDTRAEVTFKPGTGITGIVLHVRGVVPGISATAFEEAAQDAGRNCPVSKALGGTQITVTATLE